MSGTIQTTFDRVRNIQGLEDQIFSGLTPEEMAWLNTVDKLFQRQVSASPFAQQKN